MHIPIEIHMEPIDEVRAKFTLSRTIEDFIGKIYTTTDDTSDSPVAAALMGIPGVEAIEIIGNQVIVVKESGAPEWDDFEPKVRHAVNIEGKFMSETEKVAEDTPKADDVTFSLVDQMFKEHINPALAGHGGAVELIDVQDGIVVVRMMGGCQGCGMARVTLQQGVEASLKKAIPAVKGVRDITDHAAGANPYTT